ncbi:MAG: hypothetical protein JNJ83_09835 [Verrucomicrobiaceae bacterium]|nr:hypothetical protein [Verrucomicrobiaceae bacterium]
MKTPLKSVTFWMHLLVAVVGLGGAGIWYSLLEYRFSGEWSWPAVAAALCTYFPAVAGAAYVDSSSEGQPYFRSFGIIAFAVFVLLIGMSAFTIRDGSIVWGLVGSILSILFWWVVNADKACFRDVDGDGSTPNPNRKLKGTKKGWQV